MAATFPLLQMVHQALGTGVNTNVLMASSMIAHMQIFPALSVQGACAWPQACKEQLCNQGASKGCTHLPKAVDFISYSNSADIQSICSGLHSLHHGQPFLLHAPLDAVPHYLKPASPQLHITPAYTKRRSEFQSLLQASAWDGSDTTHTNAPKHRCSSLVILPSC